MRGEKKFVPLSDLKPVDAGHFPEVSVKGLYDDFASRPEIKKFLPPHVNKGRTMDKKYFFDIVNTFAHQEL